MPHRSHRTELSSHERLVEARRHVESGRWTQAIACLENTGEHNGAPAEEAEELLVHALRCAGRLNEAKSSAQASLARRPSLAMWILLGKIRRDSGDLTGAISAYESGSTLDPLCDKPHCQIAIAYEAAGDLGRAYDAARRAVILNKEAGINWLCLAKLERSHGRESAAAHCFKEAKRLLSSAADPNRHYNLACLHTLCGDQASALDHLEQFAKSHPYAAMWATSDPDLAELREHPSFTVILANKS